MRLGCLSLISIKKVRAVVKYLIEKSLPMNAKVSKEKLPSLQKALRDYLNNPSDEKALENLKDAAFYFGEAVEREIPGERPLAEEVFAGAVRCAVNEFEFVESDIPVLKRLSEIAYKDRAVLDDSGMRIKKNIIVSQVFSELLFVSRLIPSQDASIMRMMDSIYALRNDGKILINNSPNSKSNMVMVIRLLNAMNQKIANFVYKSKGYRDNPEKKKQFVERMLKNLRNIEIRFRIAEEMNGLDCQSCKKEVESLKSLVSSMISPSNQVGSDNEVKPVDVNPLAERMFCRIHELRKRAKTLESTDPKSLAAFSLAYDLDKEVKQFFKKPLESRSDTERQEFAKKIKSLAMDSNDAKILKSHDGLFGDVLDRIIAEASKWSVSRPILELSIFKTKLGKKLDGISAIAATAACVERFQKTFK